MSPAFAKCLAHFARRRYERPKRHATGMTELFHAITRHFVPPDSTKA